MAPKDAAGAGAGGSRLDRLMKLLETGSTPAARHEAARQIGELAALHTHQLPNLLRRVRRGCSCSCPPPSALSASLPPYRCQPSIHLFAPTLLISICLPWRLAGGCPNLFSLKICGKHPPRIFADDPPPPPLAAPHYRFAGF